MHYREIINETGIELLWMPKEYAEKGTYIPPCLEFKSGAVSLRLDLTEKETEVVFLHECGHLLDGTILRKLSAPQLHIVNEAKANKFMIHHKIPEWVDSHNGEEEYCTAERFCSYLNLNFSDYGTFVESEIYAYLGYEY